MIKEIIVKLKDIDAIVIKKDTDLNEVLLNYSEDDEFVLEQLSVVTEEETNDFVTNDKWLDYDDLDELVTKLYELYEKDVAELFYELPEGDRENFSASEWLDHNEIFYNNYFESNPAEAVRAVLFGDVRWNDSYVRFDGYGNLKTIEKIPYDDEANGIIVSWVNELV